MTNFDVIKNTRLNSRLRDIYFALVSLNKGWNKLRLLSDNKRLRIKFVNSHKLISLKWLDELKEFAEKNLNSEISSNISDICEEAKCQLDDLDSLLKRWNKNHTYKIPNSVEELIGVQFETTHLDFSELGKSDLETLVKAFIFKCNTAPERKDFSDDFRIVVSPKKSFLRLSVKMPKKSKLVGCFVSNGKKYKISVGENFYGFVIAKGLKKHKVKIGVWPSKINRLKDDFNEWSKSPTVYEGNNMTNWMKLAYIQASLVQSKFISSCSFEEEFYGFQRLVRLCFGRRKARWRLSI